jgi:hypothetical protein
MNVDVTVNCVIGDDETRSPYRTLDRLFQDVPSGSRILVQPGNYPGIDISTKTGFEYNIIGGGSGVELFSIKHTGNLNASLKGVTVNLLEYNAFGSTSHFDSTRFGFGGQMTCRGEFNRNGNPMNTIEFQSCQFRCNFQIIVLSGMYKFIFKNCRFDSRTIPVLMVKGGDVEISVITCQLDSSLVNNQHGCVYIYHTSTIFTKEIWTGKECMVYGGSVDNDRSTGRYDSPQMMATRVNENDVYLGLRVNSDEDAFVELAPETKFVYVVGSKPFRIVLPDEGLVRNAHTITIVNERGVLISVNGADYTQRVVSLTHLVGLNWIVH